MYLLPAYASCEVGRGMDLFVYCKIVKIVLFIKNKGPCSAIDKGTMILIAAIPIGFQIANQKTRRRSKTLKGSQRMGGQATFSENLRAAPFNKDNRMSPLLARSISLDNTFKSTAIDQVQMNYLVRYR